VGADGATHQGAYDVAFLRPLPGMSLMAPVAGEDLLPMLETALKGDGPSAIRFPRGTLPAMPPFLQPVESPVIGARWLKRAREATLTIVALGPLVLTALEAAADSPDWNVLDARFASPLDRTALRDAAASRRVLTVEEGTTRGGLGAAILELFAEEGFQVKTRCLGLPDRFIRHGDARVQRAELGLDRAGIRKAAFELVAS